VPEPFELAPGVSVNVVPPSVPSLQMGSPPSAGSVMVVPVPGPRGAPGNAAEIDLLIARLQDLEDNVYSYIWEQDTPATVWLISHPLGFQPAAVEVFEHTGTRHYPQVTYPDASTVRLDFNRDVRGTARLS
jgi:hypothetical protein